MAQEALSTTAKKAFEQVKTKARDVYNKALLSGGSEYWPNVPDGKFVSADILRQTEKAEADKLLNTLKANMEDADLAAVRREIDALVENDAEFYASYLKTKSPASIVTSPSGAGTTTPGIQEPGRESEYDTDPEKTARRSKKVSEWAYVNNTYSMCDIVCTIDVFNHSGEHIVQNIGRLQTLSYSIYQNKQPVRVLGNMNAKDYVYGQRTIAGSLVFAVFNRHWLIDIYDQLVNNGTMKNWHYVADEMPPFDITVSFANEYGYDSKMAIYGVRLMTEGQVMSINDIYIENTYQFVATDIEYMDALNAWQSVDKVGRRWTGTNSAGVISSNAGRLESQTAAQQKQSQMKGREIGETMLTAPAATTSTGRLLAYDDADTVSRADKLAELYCVYQEKLRDIKGGADSQQDLESLNSRYLSDYEYINKHYTEQIGNLRAIKGDT